MQAFSLKAQHRSKGTNAPSYAEDLICPGPCPELLGCSKLPKESISSLTEKIDMVTTDLHSVFLGIHGGKLCLSCVKSGDGIKLQLEEMNITDLSKNKEQDKRFTFIRSEKGPTTSFESAACPGWFLCTAVEADRPVSLTNKPEEPLTVTKFYFQEDQ
ncbi:Interleukin-1 receptor antagonist protein [Cricetulus griseus]|uniref:Interleukin-1 n=1 Tax=Cricetulus griseus TaxID=10029 RepID=G3IHF8_CRIGR|nr:Interleukin-1 receptor antagonist protein [Cricetulus griseus]